MNEHEIEFSTPPTKFDKTDFILLKIMVICILIIYTLVY